MKLLLAVIIMNFSDTLKIEYCNTNDLKDWCPGYIVTNVIKKDDIFIYYTEPSAWLDQSKQPIDRPKKYHLK